MTLAAIEESMRGRPKTLGKLLPSPWRLITFVYSLLLHAFMSTHCFAMVESGRVNPTVQVLFRSIG
jgi:hypothetical protein